MSAGAQLSTTPAPRLGLSPRDIQASAKGMENYFGGGAEDEARQRAQLCAERGDSDARALWLEIATAIGTLRHDAADRNGRA